MFNGERLEEIRRIWEGIYFLKHVGAIHLFFCHPLFLVSHRKILGRWAITWPVTLTRPCTSVGHTLAFNLSFCPPQPSGVTLQAVALITHAVTGNRANEVAGIGGPQPRRQPHGFPTSGIHSCVVSSPPTLGQGLVHVANKYGGRNGQKRLHHCGTSQLPRHEILKQPYGAVLITGPYAGGMCASPRAVGPLVPGKALPHMLTAVPWESTYEPEAPS